MTITRNHPALLAALWCLALVQPARSADGWADLQGKDAAARVEYLRGDRSKLAAKCIIAAIKYVGGKRYAEASRVLTQYLDFQDPDYLHQGGLKGSVLYVYPAVDALSTLGKPAVPELTKVIADAKTSDLVRRNAGWALFLMYGVNQAEGIAALVSAAHAETDPSASIRLMDEARWFAGRCIVTARNECENEVLK